MIDFVISALIFKIIVLIVLSYVLVRDLLAEDGFDHAKSP